MIGVTTIMQMSGSGTVRSVRLRAKADEGFGETRHSAPCDAAPGPATCGRVLYTDGMRMSVSRSSALALCVAAASTVAAAQTAQTRPPVARPVPLGPPIHEAPQVTCPAPLGSGVSTKQAFCDVLIGRDPAAGILIAIPPHKGDVTLTFNLHNRHTFSEEQMKDPRAAYARYTASIGALTHGQHAAQPRGRAERVSFGERSGRSD